jgi:ATP-binding cassette subfamily B protein
VLQDVSFTLQPGVVTALVGSTGAGKSSIAKLLGRTYDPDAGRVTVAGADLREIDLDGYRGRIGIVPQDAFLFRGTVASNVAYGRPDATADEVAAVVDAVGADEVLAQLPGGLDHIVEEEGRNLTTAQCQLIALARAWLARPELLVLDEATSSLDGAIEHSVLDAVTRLGVTTLMITHRQAVAAAAAEIVVLEQGRVAAAGPAADVVDSTAYARLWVAEDELIG